MSDETQLVTIYRSQGMLRAELIKSKLEAAGVPVMLKYEAVGQVLGVTIDGLGLVEVQVPEDWADDAAWVIEEQDDAVVDEEEWSEPSPDDV